MNIYRYDFDSSIESEEIEATLILAIVATESLHGETASQLGVAHLFDAQKRACVIDVTDRVGLDFNALFAGFLRREFGPSAFSVKRVASPATASPAVAA